MHTSSIKKFLNTFIFFGLAFGLVCQPGLAQSDSASSDDRNMTVDDLEAIVANLDEEYFREGGAMEFFYADQRITIVTDSIANRMRIIVPIIDADLLGEAELYRLLQANFDSALDARYALANGILWSTYIHPLSSLTATDFLSGIGQTINTAASFGSTYSSGELIYGGGDSDQIHQRELIDRLLEEGRSI